MTLLNHLLTSITIFILGIFPHHTINNKPHNQTDVKGTNIVALTPSLSPAITASSSPTVKNKNISVEPLIDCVGPDKKHFKITAEACVKFNIAWGIKPSITGNPVAGTQKIGDHTYTMKFIPDATMSTPQEAFNALNNYRNINGISSLTWDGKLVQFAQTRADYFAGKKSLDQHAGFLDFVWHQDGFTKLGFNDLGENSAYAGPISGVHLIEWIFAGDEEHNSNQLNKKWTYVGIGINNLGIDVIFAANKK